MDGRSLFLLSIFSVALQIVAPVAQSQNSRQQYPSSWDYVPPAGTAFAEIRTSYTQRRSIKLPDNDLQDRSPLPAWFRGYLRDYLEALPRAGSYQYPRVGVQIYQWMKSHPNLTVPKSDSTKSLRKPTRATTITLGSNINLTDLDERNSESCFFCD
jgi:hypothetical protein